MRIGMGKGERIAHADWVQSYIPMDRRCILSSILHVWCNLVVLKIDLWLEWMMTTNHNTVYVHWDNILRIGSKKTENEIFTGF